MENQSSHVNMLLLEGLKVTPQFSILASVLLALIYAFIVVSNVGLVALIVRSRTLQQPMYLLFCNMSLNDVFGATIIIPHVLRDMVLSSSERYIHYVDCVVQAFCVHLYGSTSHTVLMIMAFDRYLAICDPLRYAAVMTHRMVAALSVAAWATALALVAVLLGLTVRLSRCRRVISNLFCDNASLFMLSCEDVFVNQVYGLGYTVLLLGSSICSVTLTYLKIAAVCARSRSQALNSKAVQTCATHLTVYVLLLVSAFVVVALHRFPRLSDHRKAAAIVGEVALPALNALIYGLQMKEVRHRVRAVFRR